MGSGANSCIALEVTTLPVVAATIAGAGSCAPFDSLLILWFWNDDESIRISGMCACGTW